MLTQTKEDYLRALYVLQEKNDELKSADLAEYLNVSKPTVSEMIRTLRNDKLVLFSKYSKIEFTKKGFEIAKKVTMKHRLIERFLKDFLKIESKKVHEEAHRLEHAFSDESIGRIRKLLGNPKHDPHGKPIPI